MSGREPRTVIVELACFAWFAVEVVDHSDDQEEPELDIRSIHLATAGQLVPPVQPPESGGLSEEEYAEIDNAYLKILEEQP